MLFSHTFSYLQNLLVCALQKINLHTKLANNKSRNILLSSSFINVKFIDTPFILVSVYGKMQQKLYFKFL